MSTVIKVENLSKAYQLGEIGTGTLSRDLERWYARIRGKEDPFLRIGETNDRSSKGSSDVVWSLKDLNFEVQQGEVLGIIGRNGAGKSTLLKILSRVTSPTSGSIKVKGRIASLLEVGTGFHPELTGRENIYLNGAILGMRKREIDRKLEEIVDFSGVERYIDTPVKRYSSGMYVRLAFAVAAHLESEILIVDEVLAVGDAEFQKKCLGKMSEVSKGEGKTVLFVSHNMGAVKTLCTQTLILDKGIKFLLGNTTKAIESYINYNHVHSPNTNYIGQGIIKSAQIRSTIPMLSLDALEFEIKFKAKQPLTSVVLGFLIKDVNQSPLISLNNKHFEYKSLNKHEIQSGQINVRISKLPLIPGQYSIDLFLGDSDHDLEILQDALTFSLLAPPNITTVPVNYIENKYILEHVFWEIQESKNNQVQ